MFSPFSISIDQADKEPRMKQGFFLFLVLFPIVAGADELSGELKALLHRAVSTGEYQVSVLERRGETGKETLVILGETHLKTDTASHLGKEIRKHFKLFGLEGLNFNQLKPDHLSAYLKAVYPLGALFFTGGKKATNRSTIHDIVLPRSMSSEEQKMISLILSSDWRNVSTSEPTNLYLDLIKQFYHDDAHFHDWCESVGIDQKMIESANTAEIFSKAKKAIYGDSGIQIFMLEQFFPLPEKIIRWNDAIGKACKVMIGCCALVGTAALAQMADGYITEEAQACLNTAAVVGVASSIDYIRGTFNPVLPNSCQMPISPFGIGSAAVEERNLNMAQSVLNALESKLEHKTMLIVVGMLHIPGLVKLFTEKLNFHETSF